MLSVATNSVLNIQRRAVSLPVAAYPYSCPQSAMSDGRNPSHVRELDEMRAPAALADSPFAISAWQSFRDGTRRWFSRFLAA